MSRINRTPWLLAALALAASAVALPRQARAQQYGAYVGIRDDGALLISEPAVDFRPARIHVYQRSGDGWEETDPITAPSHRGGDYYGRFFAQDDRSFIVGGTLFDNSAGDVWVYRKDGGALELEATLRPEEIAEGESFGRFGQLYGDKLFVSSLGFQNVGAVWVFERDASGTFVQTARLQPAETTEQQFFGWGLSYNGDRLIVGSLEGQALVGAAYIFAQDEDGNWLEEKRLALPEDEARPGDAGLPNGAGAGVIGVGWFDDMALMGLPGRDRAEGAVYTYGYRPLTEDWVQGTTLSAFDRKPGSYFGHAFHVVDGELWISAPGADGSGAIYRFSYDSDSRTFGAASKLENTIDADDGDGFGSAVATAGDLAVVGQMGDDNGFGSAIVMERRDGTWVPTTKLLVPGEPGPPAIAGSEIPCDDSAGTADRYACSHVDLLSFLPLASIGGGRGTEANDIWGWTDPETDREYALVGRSDGTAFVDITDPVNPVFVGNLPKTPGSVAAVWRDVKVFNNYAFVVADGAGQAGMQVFDLRRLREVTDPPERFEADAVYRGIASAHNVAIDEDTGMAYALGANGGGQTCGGGLHMIDINDPLQPKFVGCFQDPTTGQAGTGYTHDAQCVVYHGPDTEHDGREICFGANENALSIADVTDKENPVALSSASYPYVAYAHQGWLTEDQRYFYLGDELDEGQAGRGNNPEWTGTRTLIWDVSDLDDPVLAKEHFGETFTTDHNMYVRGNLLYQSNYESGLRILNITDPENPVEVGYLDTVPESETVRMNGSWSNYPYFQSGTIAVTSMQQGVFFVRYRPRELLP